MTTARHIVGRRLLLEMDVASVGRAIQNMWLLARVEGIGLGGVSLFDSAALTQLLSMPAGRHPAMQHLVVTGRGAPPELVAAADTVTDMTLVKHAFQAGVPAMPGIEW